jgi:Peptidase family S41
MKHFFTLLFIAVCFTVNAQVTDSLQTQILQPAAMQADFKYLRRLLEETHPGLYRYNTKEQMSRRMDSVYGLLNTEMKFYDYYRLLASFIGDIRCAHTTTTPFKDWQGYLSRNAKMLPFFMYPIQNKMYVLFNGTSSTNILPGFELLTINRKSMEEIKKIMWRCFPGDGFIQTSKNAVLTGITFMWFYYMYVEQTEQFDLTFKSLSGDTVKVNVSAQKFKPILKWFKNNTVNEQMLKYYNPKKPKQPWRLSFPKDLEATALLRFDVFGGVGPNNTEDEARLALREFMDKSLAEITNKKCTNLIIDVTGNGGGWDTQGVELFTYLMKTDSPVRFFRRQFALTDSSEFYKFLDLSLEQLQAARAGLKREADGTFSEMENLNPDMRLQYPKPNRFKGNVYILMNGQSGSTTAEFLAVAKYNKVGIFIGEESGGAYEGGNGGNFIHLELPNTKIEIGTPVVSGETNVDIPKQKGRGTMPDYFISNTIEQLLTNTLNDKANTLLKELINKKN